MGKVTVIEYIRPNADKKAFEVEVNDVAYQQWLKLQEKGWFLTAEDCDIFINICVDTGTEDISTALVLVEQVADVQPEEYEEIITFAYNKIT